MNNAVAFFQLVSLGFILGISGPCMLSCMPLLAAYAAASGKKWPRLFGDFFFFFGGRLLAYTLLGALAGISAWLLRRFTGGTPPSSFFTPLAGAISILLGLIIIFDKKVCRQMPESVPSAGLFALGFSVGAAPCVPLMLVLSEITLISHNFLGGACYGLAFGLGIVFAGLLVIVPAAGLLKYLPLRLIRSEKGRYVFRMAFAAVMIILGVLLIINPAIKAYG